MYTVVGAIQSRNLTYTSPLGPDHSGVAGVTKEAQGWKQGS